MKKNVLISTPSIFNWELFPPYAWGVLKTYCDAIPELQDSINWLDPIYYRLPAAKLLAGIDLESLDVLGLSCYVWSSNINFDIAQMVRSRNPNCLIVAGGPDVPHNDPEIFKKHPYLDVIAVRDGEVPFSEILKRLTQGNKEFGDIPGLILKQRDGSAVSSGPPNKPTILNQSAYIGQEAIYARIIENHLRNYPGARFIAQLETSRGCPYTCSFCDWAANTGTKMRTFELDRVQTDVDWIGRNKIDTVIFADSNFGFYDRDLLIADMLVEAKRKYGYPKSLFYGLEKRTSERIIKITKKFFAAGLIDHYCLSIEHLDKDVLKAMNRVSLPDSERAKLIAAMHADKVPVLSQLIFGSPNDSFEKLQNCVCSLIEQKADAEFILYPFMVLPNSPSGHQDYQKKWNIRLRRIWTQVSRRLPVFDERVDSCSNVIVGANTYEPLEFVDMMTYSNFMIAFHCGGLTRFLTQYIVRTHALSYQEIYKQLYDYLLKTTSTIGERFRQVYKHNHKFVFDTEVPGTFEIELPEAKEFGYPCLINPEDFLLWHTLNHLEEFYQEVEIFLKELIPQIDSQELRSLLQFQRSIMITADYNSDIGKHLQAQYDWPSYFRGGPLREGPIHLHLKDQFCGIKSDIPLDFQRYAGSRRILRHFDATIGIAYFRIHRAYFSSWECETAIESPRNSKTGDSMLPSDAPA